MALVTLILLFLFYTGADAHARTISGFGYSPPLIQSVQLSGTNVQFSASGPYYVGTLTTNLSPQTPTFNNLSGSSYALVSSGGSCSGGDTTHFQIIGDGVYTSTLSANILPGYKLCVSASVTGAPAYTATFTGITEGNKIDAAVTYCAANGGGNGSSASPWQAACIQAAVNAAVKGDTVFLAAGNWALNITASAVTITPAISVVGAGSGNTFNTSGNPSNGIPANPSNMNLCPSTTITCIAVTGGYTVGAPGGQLIFSGCGSSASGGAGDTAVAHFFLDGSTSGAGGNSSGALQFQSCYTSPETVTLNDIRALFLANSNLTNGSEAIIYWNNSWNVTVKDSVISSPLNPANPGNYSSSSWFLTTGIGYTFKNSVEYMVGIPPIGVDNILVTGSTIIEGYDTSGNTLGPTSAVGVPGCGIGLTSGCVNGLHNGSQNISFVNNYMQGNGEPFAVGGGLNDPGTAGGLEGLTLTGNTVVGTYTAIDSCVWHYHNPSSGLDYACSPAVAATSAATTSGSVVTFHVRNTANIAAIFGSPGPYFMTAGFTTSAYNIQPVANPPFTTYWTATSESCAGGSCTITASCGGGGAQPPCPTGSSDLNGVLGNYGGAEGMQINGTVNADCSENSPSTPVMAITNNSIVGTSAASLNAAGTGIIGCRLGSGTFGPHNNTVVNYQASQNYLSSPSNNYVSDPVGTISPAVPGASNYCAGGTTFTGTDSQSCQTTGFTTLPTVSFALGLLQYDPWRSVYSAPFTSTSFTAQYGAVQWLASTSPTPPTSTGQAGTACGGSACSWSYVPPAYMVGATHGNTVYLWVMDSANHISSPVSSLIP